MINFLLLVLYLTFIIKKSNNVAVGLCLSVCYLNDTKGQHVDNQSLHNTISIYYCTERKTVIKAVWTMANNYNKLILDDDLNKYICALREDKQYIGAVSQVSFTSLG